MAVTDKIPKKGNPNTVEGLELDCQINNQMYRKERDNNSFYCQASIFFMELEEVTPKFCRFHSEVYLSKDNQRGYYKCSRKE